jgi:hypothetical protein
MLWGSAQGSSLLNGARQPVCAVPDFLNWHLGKLRAQTGTDDYSLSYLGDLPNHEGFI